MFLVNWKVQNEEETGEDAFFPQFTHAFNEWNGVSFSQVETDIVEYLDVTEELEWEKCVLRGENDPFGQCLTYTTYVHGGEGYVTIGVIEILPS